MNDQKSERTERTPRYYIASRTCHAPSWRANRDQCANVTSTWIDEAGEGQSNYPALAARCIDEIRAADFLVIYCENDEPLKSALIEAGAALAMGKRVYAIGGNNQTMSRVFREHPLWRECPSVTAAVDQAGEELRDEPTPLQPIDEPQRFTKAAMEKFEAITFDAISKYTQCWRSEGFRAGVESQSETIERMAKERDDIVAAFRADRQESGKTIERLTAERDAAHAKGVSFGKREALNYSAEERENYGKLKAALEETKNLLKWEQEGHNFTARERHQLRDALDKERAEVEWLKKERDHLGRTASGYSAVLADEKRIASDLRRQLAEAKEEPAEFCREIGNKFGKPILHLGDAACLLGMQAAQLAEWQAVAWKKDAALEAFRTYCRQIDHPPYYALYAQVEEALSTPPATALLDELERAWKAGHTRLAPLSEIPADTVHRAWLASETRQRFTTASQSDSNE